MSGAARRDTLVVGTRGSLLARAQTQWVVDALRRAHPQIDIRQEVITTRGDREPHRPLPEIGGKGLFTEELERALLDGSIDLAVHSAKDLPTRLPPGLDVLAYPQREDPRDAWISAQGMAFDDLKPGSAIGTTSLRRQAQLLARRPDLTFVPLRGNVDTRLNKVRRGECAGAVLAMAGLRRLGLAGQVTHPFELDMMLPAPGQGAVALEGRAGDDRVCRYLTAVHDETTAFAVSCERAILGALDAGCRAPVAILAEVKGPRVQARALVAAPHGDQVLRASGDRPADEWRGLADHLVCDLRAAGADEIIAACRPA